MAEYMHLRQRKTSLCMICHAMPDSCLFVVDRAKSDLKFVCVDRAMPDLIL